MSVKTQRKDAKRLAKEFPATQHSRHEILKMVCTYGMDGARSQLLQEAQPVNHGGGPFVDPVAANDPKLRQIQLEVQRVTQGG